MNFATLTWIAAWIDCWMFWGLRVSALQHSTCWPSLSSRVCRSAPWSSLLRPDGSPSGPASPHTLSTHHISSSFTDISLLSLISQLLQSSAGRPESSRLRSSVLLSQSGSGGTSAQNQLPEGHASVSLILITSSRDVDDHLEMDMRRLKSWEADLCEFAEIWPAGSDLKQ